MLLSFIVHTHSLRYWLPATVMLGTAPAYVLSWGVWRLLSSVLPARLYHKLDDRLYCIYQSMVLFFFENYTGVEVRLLRAYLTGCIPFPSVRVATPWCWVCASRLEQLNLCLMGSVIGRSVFFFFLIKPRRSVLS